MFFGVFGTMFCDFMKVKKMRGVLTIIFAAVSRRDLCYVSENKGVRFEKMYPIRILLSLCQICRLLRLLIGPPLKQLSDDARCQPGKLPSL